MIQEPATKRNNDESSCNTGGQAPAHKHIDKLLEYVKQGKVRLDDIITHRLPLTKLRTGIRCLKGRKIIV